MPAPHRPCSIDARSDPSLPRVRFATPWLHDVAPSGGRPMALSDLGNSERFAVAHAEDVRHCQATRKWLVWEGRRWAADLTGEIKRRAKSTVRNILIEAAVMDEEKHRGELIAHQIRSESDRAIRAMISLAASDEKIAKRLSDFDSDPMQLNVSNGMLELDSCQLRPHRREDLLTKLAPVEFNADASCPQWDAFLGEIMGERCELVAFLQRAAGYSLTGDISEHCFFLLHGDGANGKSTFLEVLRHVLGDYAAQTDFSTFLVAKGQPIRNDIARLRGARLVTGIESDAGRRLAESLVKALTGGDTVSARFLYSEHFEFQPEFKLWLATNHKPRILGTDLAIWRRIRLVPFTVTIPSTRQDRYLAQKLKTEGSGILNWALAGLRDWQRQGLQEPEAVDAATEDYRQSQDFLGHFIDAKITPVLGSEVGARALYSTYKDWCEAAGEFRMNEREFSGALTERRFSKRRVGPRVGKPPGVYWRDIAVLV